MSTRAIVPVKLSLTEGDFYTLWAPKWRQHGSEWQAFLGDDEAVLAFNSPAELLCFVESGTKHDLLDHPHWDQFAGRDADLSLIHISEPTRPCGTSRMPSSA